MYKLCKIISITLIVAYPVSCLYHWIKHSYSLKQNKRCTPKYKYFFTLIKKTFKRTDKAVNEDIYRETYIQWHWEEFSVDGSKNVFLTKMTAEYVCLRQGKIWVCWLTVWYTQTYNQTVRDHRLVFITSDQLKNGFKSFNIYGLKVYVIDFCSTLLTAEAYSTLFKCLAKNLRYIILF
jgi:hypothetical protein